MRLFLIIHFSKINPFKPYAWFKKPSSKYPFPSEFHRLCQSAGVKPMDKG